MVARLVVMLIEMQAYRDRPLREELVMKIFYGHSSSRLFKRSSCQLMAKECTLSTGKLHLGGLPRNSVVRITDHPDMTSAVYRGHKGTNQTNKFSYVMDVPQALWFLNMVYSVSKIAIEASCMDAFFLVQCSIKLTRMGSTVTAIY